MADRRTRARRRRSTEPTICPHCLADQGSTVALSQHVRFACPILRGATWEILAQSAPDEKGWVTFRGRKGSQVVNLRVLDGLTPTDRDFDASMQFAVEQMRSKLGR